MEGRVGGAVVEYRLLYQERPRSGDLITVRTSVRAMSGRSHRLVHWLFDVRSGDCLCTSEAVAVTLDLQTRRAVELPEAQRRRMEAFVIAEPRRDERPGPAGSVCAGRCPVRRIRSRCDSWRPAGANRWPSPSATSKQALIVRLSGPPGPGIDRRRELQVLEAAAAAGLTPAPLHADPRRGELVLPDLGLPTPDGTARGLGASRRGSEPCCSASIACVRPPRADSIRWPMPCCGWSGQRSPGCRCRPGSTASRGGFDPPDAPMLRRRSWPASEPGLPTTCTCWRASLAAGSSRLAAQAMSGWTPVTLADDRRG
ncbi:MAG: hypothetical protein U5R48_07840 [Gammaproteobacteria bacterium]|nr:hypothetical protein [Gammaproteobacteria bacterium]